MTLGRCRCSSIVLLRPVRADTGTAAWVLAAYMALLCPVRDCKRLTILDWVASSAQQQPSYASYRDSYSQLTYAALCRTPQGRAPCSSAHWPTSSCRESRTSSGSRGCPHCQGEQSRAGLQHLLSQALAHVHKLPSCDGLLVVVALGILSWAVIWPGGPSAAVDMALWQLSSAGLGQAGKHFIAV